MTIISLRFARLQSALAGLVLALVSISAGESDTRVYQVGKRVSEFPDREDLSTPEAAYASLHRAIAAEGDVAFARLSVPSIAAFLRGQKRSAPARGERERRLSAEILEFHVWEQTHAVIIARMETSRTYGNFDLRILERVNGAG